VKDITEGLVDINPTDRVFEHGGKFVKVRMVKQDPPPGSPSFGVAFIKVSGSETNEEGRAIEHGEGWRIAPAEIRTVLYDQPLQLAELLANMREEVVLQTLQASDLQNQIDQLL
jgi:hypothetical protein